MCKQCDQTIRGLFDDLFDSSPPRKPIDSFASLIEDVVNQFELKSKGLDKLADAHKAVIRKCANVMYVETVFYDEDKQPIVSLGTDHLIQDWSSPFGQSLRDKIEKEKADANSGDSSSNVSSTVDDLRRSYDAEGNSKSENNTKGYSN